MLVNKAMANLKTWIEVDPKNPKVVKNVKDRGSRITMYSFNAQEIDSEGNPVPLPDQP